MKRNLSILLSIVILLLTVVISMSQERDLEDNCDTNQCFLELAKENNKSSYCNFTTKDYTCYYFLALHLENPIFCEFEENQTKCLQSYAISAGDITLCLNFQEEQKVNCVVSYAINRGEINACDFVENRPYCIYSYAIYFNEPLLCILSEEYHQECVSYITNKNDENN